MQSLMTEEKLKLKRVTGGKYHNRSLVFHFEKDDLNHDFWTSGQISPKSFWGWDFLTWTN